MMFKKFWYIWCKALGGKAHDDKSTADNVAIIRTIIVLVYIVTNCFIVANIIWGWIK